MKSPTSKPAPLTKETILNAAWEALIKEEEQPNVKEGWINYDDYAKEKGMHPTAAQKFLKDLFDRGKLDREKCRGRDGRIRTHYHPKVS